MLKVISHFDKIVGNTKPTLVYASNNDSAPRFLLYDKGIGWHWESAEQFEPWEEVKDEGTD